MDKTKVIQLGGDGDNRINNQCAFDFEWTQSFISLGIEFDLGNFDEITDLYIEEKLSEMKRLMNIWSSRKLTSELYWGLKPPKYNSSILGYPLQKKGLESQNHC